MSRALAAAGLACALAGPAEARPTYRVDYVVRFSARDPGHATVRWLLAGIDEIASFRLVFRDDRTSDVSGTGQFVRDGRTLHWTPGGPYAHLRYRVAVDHVRPPGAHFDSHAAPDWIATRALYLFPEINVTFRGPERAAQPAARLRLRLPHGWRAATALAPLDQERSPNTFVVDEPGKHFHRPRGWLLVGRIARHRRHIAGSAVTVAVAPGSALDVRRLLRLYARTLPLLANVLGPPPPRLLVVSAPDPMWHGGLSGEDSFFVNGHLPIRSADRTSSYLHELFHVWQPFRPGRDGRWITEGLAEYYSLVLQHRAGRLSPRGHARGLQLFAKYGRWNVDLSRTREPAALNNSAPLVMAALDARIRKATNNHKSLDDVVRALARDANAVTTATLLRTVESTTGTNETQFFRRHVYRGEMPPVPTGDNQPVTAARSPSSRSTRTIRTPATCSASCAGGPRLSAGCSAPTSSASGPTPTFATSWRACAPSWTSRCATIPRPSACPAATSG